MTVDGDTPWIRAKSHPWDYDRTEVDELSAQENCRVFAYKQARTRGRWSDRPRTRELTSDHASMQSDFWTYMKEPQIVVI